METALKKATTAEIEEVFYLEDFIFFDQEINMYRTNQSDIAIAEIISKKLNKEVTRNQVAAIRKKNNIAAAPSKLSGWGGRRNGAGRKPKNRVIVAFEQVKAYVEEKADEVREFCQEIAGLVDMNSGYDAVRLLHKRCVRALSRMYGGGDSYLWRSSGEKNKIQSGKKGKGGNFALAYRPFLLLT